MQRWFHLYNVTHLTLWLGVTGWVVVFLVSNNKNKCTQWWGENLQIVTIRNDDRLWFPIVIWYLINDIKVAVGNMKKGGYAASLLSKFFFLLTNWNKKNMINRCRLCLNFATFHLNIPPDSLSLHGYNKIKLNFHWLGLGPLPLHPGHG